jgi:hypothetical protein
MLFGGMLFTGFTVHVQPNKSKKRLASKRRRGVLTGKPAFLFNPGTNSTATDHARTMETCCKKKKTTTHAHKYLRFILSIHKAGTSHSDARFFFKD